MLTKRGILKSPAFSVCWFLWCKYSDYHWFQATNHCAVESQCTKSALTGCMSQLQSTFTPIPSITTCKLKYLSLPPSPSPHPPSSLSYFLPLSPLPFPFLPLSLSFSLSLPNFLSLPLPFSLSCTHVCSKFTWMSDLLNIIKGKMDIQSSYKSFPESSVYQGNHG